MENPITEKNVLKRADEYRKSAANERIKKIMNEIILRFFLNNKFRLNSYLISFLSIFFS